MSPSTIDLMVTDSRVSSSPLRTIEKLSSDHYPVQFEINCRWVPQTKRMAFNYTRANWESYKVNISHTLSPILEQFSRATETSNTEIDLIINQITLSIISAQEQSIPKIEINQNSQFIPTPLLRSLITAKNYFRRRVTRSHNWLDKCLHDKFKKRVECETATIAITISSVIKNKNHVHLPSLDSPNPGGRKLTSPQAKAEAIAANFATNHENTLANSLVRHTQHVNNTVKQFLNRPMDNSDCPSVTINEVASLIKGIKINKASGLDEINGRLIKHLPVVAIHLIALTFTFFV